jgi:N-acetyl-gamma-glutamyl-phosphate reductase
MIGAGIFGATGYTGYELVKLLQRHPQVDVVFATSQSFAGQKLSEVYPQAPHLPLILGEEAPLDAVDVVFLCLPHAAAAETAVLALAAGVTVIDLSADFRLKDAVTYAAWYDKAHPAPHLLADAVYGLTEYTRDQLPGARLVATPGCYPTSILLPLRPLLTANLPITGPIIADAKSGISGAGRTPTQNTHFVEAHNNFSPYKIGRSHRHLPEIEQVMGWFRSDAPPLIFSPTCCRWSGHFVHNLCQLCRTRDAGGDTAVFHPTVRPRAIHLPAARWRAGHPGPCHPHQPLRHRPDAGREQPHHHLGHRQPYQRRGRTGSAKHECGVWA